MAALEETLREKEERRREWVAKVKRVEGEIATLTKSLEARRKAVCLCVSVCVYMFVCVFV